MATTSPAGAVACRSLAGPSACDIVPAACSHLGDRCNLSLQKIGLPAKLQQLEMGYSFDQSVCNIRWPRGLQTLAFGVTFNRPLQDVLLPATLCELHFGNRFDQVLDGICWPSQLQLLHFGLTSITPWLP